jgi:HNH endonuclease
MGHVLCQCGCGLSAPIADRDRPRRGHVKGRPLPYRQGHHKRSIMVPSGRYRRKITSRGRVGLHVLVAEKALGKPLPKGAIVHHVDGNTLNNAPSNLVICQDQAYHCLLHKRQRARQRHLDSLKSSHA